MTRHRKLLISSMRQYQSKELHYITKCFLIKGSDLRILWWNDVRKPSERSTDQEQTWNCCYVSVWTHMYVHSVYYVTTDDDDDVPSSPGRTHTLMQTSCWRQPSSWLRPESVTPRRSTRQPDTWRSESRTLSGGWNTGSCCWTCPCPSTRTPKRWDTDTIMETQTGTHCQASCWTFHLHSFLFLLLHRVSVFPAVVVDGGAPEAAAGRRLLRLRGFGPDSDPAVSAAADSHTGSNAQCH